ncbi:carbohydrate ABC transporter permease [Actinopolymorpha sp. B17G11]|uniref:carbohydrate ABC transporter permease n=1 Tax=unclassified Actinopolymorpha TaxID=2627063 RepID=UPI0032D8CEC0
MTAVPQVATRELDAPEPGPASLRRRRRGYVREVVVTLALLPVCLVWIYPFLWMVSASLKTDNEIFGTVGLIPEEVQWENYTRAWYEANIGPYFWNTVIITIASIAIVTVTTAMIGYVLGRYSFPGKKVLVIAFVATLFLPEGYTIIPVFELINRLGLSGSIWGIILAESGGAHVIMVFLFAGYFRQLPKELEEAARIDGAGFFRIFWQVMLPLAKPAIATAIILSLMRVWNSFLIPLVLTLARPELRTLAVGVYSFQGENMTDWSGMAAASTISLLPIVVIFLLLQRYFVEGVAGAVRG